MATTIKIKNSTTPGNTPSSLEQGEMAINVTDGRLFYGSGSGNDVKEFTGTTIDTGSFATTGSNTFIGNQVVSGNLDISGSIDVTNIIQALILSGSLRTDKISFTEQGTFTGVQGDLGYSFADGKFTFYIENDVPIELGQTLYARVRNNDSVVLTKGTIVDFNDTVTGQTPRVKRAIATSGSDCSCFVGVVLEDIGLNGFGAIMLNGVARGLNLSSFNNGDQIYLSSTSSGSFTTTIPTPPVKAIRIGKILNASASPTQGVLYVRPENRTVYFDLDLFKQTYNTGSFTGSFIGNGSGLTNLPPTPPASPTNSVQFNNGGVFGGDGSFLFSPISLSFGQGRTVLANGAWSHAQGLSTQANALYSHAEGSNTIADGEASHAEGLGTNAQGNFQHVQGQYNITSSTPSAFIVGNGKNSSDRSNLIFAAGNSVEITGSLLLSGNLNVTNDITASNILSTGNIQAGVAGSGFKFLGSSDGDLNTPNFADVSSPNSGISVVNDTVNLVINNAAVLQVSGSKVNIGGNSFFSEEFNVEGNISASGIIYGTFQQITGVTVTSQSWGLTGSIYSSSITNSNITVNTVVDIIPNNSDYNIVIAAQLLPQNISSNGEVTLFSINQPTDNINVTLNLFK
jgi:hypothetical protein